MAQFLDRTTKILFCLLLLGLHLILTLPSFSFSTASCFGQQQRLQRYRASGTSFCSIRLRVVPVHAYIRYLAHNFSMKKRYHRP